MSTTDEAEYARLAARAEHGLTATGSRVGIDEGTGTGPPQASAARAMPWPYGPVLGPLPPRPAATGGLSASRGHPGDPGFAGGHDVPAAAGERLVWSVWQHAQRAWQAAGAEWSAAARPRHIPAPAHEASLPAPADPPAAAHDAPSPAATYGVPAPADPAAAAYGVPALTLDAQNGAARDAAARGVWVPFRRSSPGPDGTAAGGTEGRTFPSYQGPPAAAPDSPPPARDGSPPAALAERGPAERGPAERGPAERGPATWRRRWSERRTRRRLLLAGVAAFAVVAAGSGFVVLNSGGPPARNYPAARLAGTVFGGDAIKPGLGVAQTMGRVASYGGTTVAVGSQAGGDVPRAQFFVSHDDGTTWGVAAVTAPGGGAPSPGHAAQLITHGPDGWLAVGPDSIWTSTTGQSWTLASSAGITPADADDQLWVLTPTGSGFLVAGQDPAEGTAVIWTSPDGLHWQRMTAAQLLLTADGRTVTDLTGAAVSGSDILLSGHILTAAGGAGAATWLSTDDGQTWRWAPVPVNHGATSALAGIAANGAGFVAIRPGSGSQGSNSQRSSSPGRSGAAQADGVVYVSADGTSWQYAATLTASNGVQLGLVTAGPGGFVALGRGPGGDMGAYVSPTGMSWGSAIAFGPAPPSVTGATVTGGGTVVVTGSTGAPGRQQPYLALAPAGQAARDVPVTAVPGGTISQVTVDAVAVSGNRRVAVGEAGGSPAVWTATGSSWSAAPIAPAPVPASPATVPASPLSVATSGSASAAAQGAAAPHTADAGSPLTGSSATPAADAQKLTSVVHGPAGWLATGEALAGPAQRPLLLTSADGTVWNEAGQDGSPLTGANAVALQAASGPAGYVVAGDVTTSAGTFPAAWWSRDLRTWNRAVGSASGRAAAGDPGEMLGVTAGPSGYVAVGTQGIAPAVWTSRDGRAWRMATLTVPVGTASASLRQVAVSGPHVVALGEERWSSGAQAAFAEVSANGGRTWRLVTLPSPRGEAIPTALTPMRGGFTAVGAYGTPGHRDVVVWTSSDGSAWNVQIPNGPGLSGTGIQEITGLAASGSGSLTGVGFTASASAEQPTVWNVPAG